MRRALGSQGGRARLAALVAAGAMLGASLPTVADAHVISYRTARATAQAFADRYAGQPTHINGIYRLTAHSFYVQADWDKVDPTGCHDCGHEPDGGGFFDTPLTRYYAIAMHSACLGAHSPAAPLRPCRAHAFVTEVLAPLPL